jgi:hypothetical protein
MFRTRNKSLEALDPPQTSEKICRRKNRFFELGVNFRSQRAAPKEKGGPKAACGVSLIRLVIIPPEFSACGLICV